MAEQPYRVCTRCVLDTTDPEIQFDADGVCNHCLFFDEFISKGWYPNEDGEIRLARQIETIKRDGAGRDYDCLLGLSGGIDSSYLALKLKEYGLRPLAIHVDAGWNSELAAHNIERIVRHCGYELFTIVLDWREVRDLQLAFLKSGVPNQDVAQDHGFFASMYRFAVREKVRWVVNGGNIATESVFPHSWVHSPMDAINLKAIHKEFGTLPLKKYETVSFWDYYIYYPYLRGMRTFRPLNYMHYNKSSALQYLQGEIGYKEYGRKHGESLWTKFLQNYFLVKRFGYDARKPHLSSQILACEIDRDQALRELAEPLYDEQELHDDREYVARKLGISVDELESYIAAPLRHYGDYPNWDRRYRLFKRAQRQVERVFGKRLGRYS